MSLSILYSARTDVGVRRTNNEDAAYASNRLLLVADGMGGLPFGEVASGGVLEAFRALDAAVAADGSVPVDVAARLADTARAANRRLAERIREDPALAGMGTTLTVLANDGERLALLHVGDSRLYRRRGGELVQLTRDQTAVQDLVDAGLLAPGDIRTHPLRSVLNQAIDGRDDVALQPSWPDLRAGDRVLLCSDGVSDYVEQAELAACLGLPERWEAAVELTRAAIRAGSTDNITAVVADLVDGELPAQRPICFGPTA